MKTSSFAAAQAIRKHYRTGMSVDQLAAMYHASEYIIGKVLRTRTIEAAAAVLDDGEIRNNNNKNQNASSTSVKY